MDILVVGGGRVGTHLASLLLAEGHRVKIIEMRAEEVPRLSRELPPDSVVAGNGTDPSVLDAAGIDHARVVAAVTGVDETNLVVTSLARFEYRVSRTIARIKDPRNAWMFTPMMGVDVAVNQADIMAHLIAEEMSVGNMMTLLKLQKGEYSVVEEKVHPSAEASGKAVCSLRLPKRCVLAAVIRQGSLIVPHGDTVLQPSDEVLAIVHASEAPQLAGILGGPERGKSSSQKES